MFVGCGVQLWVKRTSLSVMEDIDRVEQFQRKFKTLSRSATFVDSDDELSVATIETKLLDVRTDSIESTSLGPGNHDGQVRIALLSHLPEEVMKVFAVSKWLRNQADVHARQCCAARRLVHAGRGKL